MSELARTMEGLMKHLQFAKQAVEEGWNARDDRMRALNLQAAIATIQNVERELDAIADQEYAKAKTEKKL